MTFSTEAFTDREPIATAKGSKGESSSWLFVANLQAIHDALKIMMWIFVAVSTAAGALSAEFQNALQVSLCGFVGMVALSASSSLFLLLYNNPVRWM